MELTYEPKPPILRRKPFRRLALAALLILAVAFSIWQGPACYWTLLRMYYLHQAMYLIAPLDRVVYEEDPAKQNSLLTSNPTYRRFNDNVNTYGQNGDFPFTAFTVPTLQKLQKLLEPNGIIHTYFPLFAGWRQAPSGPKCLIVVFPPGNGMHPTATSASGDWQVKIAPCADVLTPKGAVQTSFEALPLADRSLADKAVSPLYVRCYAGQPDPKDPSHFTIAYEIGNQSGIIDGYLRSDNSISMQARGFPPQ